jgi:arginine decarboxylase
MNRYGLDIWGEDNFLIDNGKLSINHGCRPKLLDIVKDLRDRGIRGPMLLRFPHLIKKQISLLHSRFQRAFKELNYQGSFQAVFPLKVNQYPSFIKPLLEIGKEFNYGLEAGSKAELLIAMAYSQKNSPILVNGFKDRELISLSFLSAKMGQDITLTIEGINELESIIEVAKKSGDKVMPSIGLRIKLHSSGIGLWAKSGGINSKFGLTSTELLEAMNLMKKHNLLDRFTMIHFHIGSQITNIAPLKKALKEAGNIYSDLIKLGAENLSTINLGGGLAVEYSQNSSSSQVNYSLKEYANDVVFMLQTISRSKKVKEPNIILESGRFIAANHAVLIAPVLELFSKEYSINALRLKETNPPLIDELYELYKDMNRENAREFLHDSFDHLNSLFTLFDLGYIDLIDRSNSEILVHLIMKKSIALLKDENLDELLKLKDHIQEKYLVNFSIFQSMADFWGLKQSFPIMPIDKLNQKPTHSANIWDITCDSDGEIEFDDKNPLYLHNVDVEREDYFLAFFLLGAYQETLGMKHNLFSKPTEATINIDENSYDIININNSPTIIEILDDLEYDVKSIEDRLRKNLLISSFVDENKREDEIENLLKLMSENGYLKTID